MNWARTVLPPWLSLMMVALLGQFFLAGAGTFGLATFDAHSILGMLLLLAGLIALMLAALARTLVAPVAIGFVLLIVQMGLGASGFDYPWLGAIHGLNAVVATGMFGATTGRAWRMRRAEAGTVAPATPPVTSPM